MSVRAFSSSKAFEVMSADGWPVKIPSDTSAGIVSSVFSSTAYDWANFGKVTPALNMSRSSTTVSGA